MLGVKDWELWKKNYINSSSIVLSLDKWKIHIILIFWERVIFDISENEKFTKANDSIWLCCSFYQAEWPCVTALLRGELFWQMAAQWDREDYIGVDHAAGSQACRTHICCWTAKACRDTIEGSLWPTVFYHLWIFRSL